MKHRYIFSVILALLILFTGCSQHTKSKETKTVEKVEKSKIAPYSVYLNGQEKKDITPVMSVKLYFMQTVKAMGMTVEKKEKGVYHIYYNDELYILNCYPEVTLGKQGEEYADLMLPFPGNTEFCCDYDGNDVLVDLELLRSTLFSMGCVAQIGIDEENLIVDIQTMTMEEYDEMVKE